MSVIEIEKENKPNIIYIGLMCYIILNFIYFTFSKYLESKKNMYVKIKKVPKFGTDEWYRSIDECPYTEYNGSY